MKILAFESSCDETAVAVVENGRNVLTDQIFSQADLHAIYGGVVPEIASRSHVEVISRLAERAVQAAGIEKAISMPLRQRTLPALSERCLWALTLPRPLL